MGWTSISVHELNYNFQTKKYDRKSWLDNNYNSETKDYKWEVLKSSMVGTTWYGAIKRTKKATNEIIVFGETILTAIDHGEFFYKEVSESMGPYTIDCPLNILKLLTPTDDPYSLQWRDKCVAKHQFIRLSRKWWDIAQDSSRTRYLVYEVPYEIKDKNEVKYYKGDKIYLTYGKYRYHGKVISCWTDGDLHFSKKDIDIFKCIFVLGDYYSFTPLYPKETKRIVDSDYTQNYKKDSFPF